MFCRVSASRGGRIARNAAYTRWVKIFRKPVTNRSDRTRPDWLAHYFNGGPRYSRSTEWSRSNLFGPARLCPIIGTRRCKCATIYEIERVYPPGDTAISWIKFRIAVNLDHLLRHGKHNFKLSFAANKHEPRRAERFLRVSPPRINSSPRELPTTDGGFEELFMRDLSQIAPFVGFICQEEVTRFSGIFHSRRCRAARHYWEMETWSEFTHRRVLQFQI